MAIKGIKTYRLVGIHLSNMHLAIRLHPLVTLGTLGLMIPVATTINPTVRRSVFRYCSSNPYHKAKRLKESFGVLGLDDDCSSSDAKEAYVQLVKLYHPDGKSKMANAHKFSQVKEAYQTVSVHLEKQKSSQQELDNNEEEMFDIKHTAPQHRQYLDFEGIGTGSPLQRERQYQTFRASRAASIAMEHKVEKLAAHQDERMLLVLKDKRATRRMKTTNTIDRMVEDLIQQSMANGEFNDLAGKGKPLPNRTGHNPFMDVSQHNLNQVLVNNGYVPEWIQLQKDINVTLADLRKDLLKERLKLGAEPLNSYNVDKWQGLRDDFTDGVVKLNKKIDDLNLIVPIIKLQMVHLKPQRELDKVVKRYEEVKPDETQDTSLTASDKVVEKEGHGMFYKMVDKLGEKILDKIMPP